MTDLIDERTTHRPRRATGRTSDLDVGYAIVARGLVKLYGDNAALAGIDIEVHAGTVTAVLGPNGAGKTTAVRILTTLTDATAGTATVAGFDVATEGGEVRRRIGLAAQDATVDPLLTGRENLVMLGELHQLRRKDASARAVELLEQFSLTDAADRVVSGYSGGMRRRLDLAATLVARPQVLFLDEPTTGLDPRARTELWEVLDTLVDSGTTLLLTTQYLDEAERLADDIIVIDRGQRHRPRRLPLAQAGGRWRPHPCRRRRRRPPRPRRRRSSAKRPAPSRSSTPRPARSPPRRPAGSTPSSPWPTHLRDAGIAVEDLSIRQPTLDDVFLTLTGEVRHDDVESNEEAHK